MKTNWMWQEHGGKPIKITVRAGEQPDAALKRHFKEHEKFRLESSGRKRRALRDFLPEVTPGILRLVVDGAVVWSSEDASAPTVKQLAKSLREAISAVRYHADPLNPKNKTPRGGWMREANDLLKRVQS